jgi:predicted enzyme related to lactoylglutathione lyase
LTGWWITLARMSIKNALASVAVKDLNAAIEWYGKVLGKPPDSRPMPEVAEWKFERGGWLQVYRLPERAGSGSFTLAVSNIDEHVTQLAKLGIDTSQRSSGDKAKTVMIADPDGNHIAFAEAIDASMAR